MSTCVFTTATASLGQAEKPIFRMTSRSLISSPIIATFSRPIPRSAQCFVNTSILGSGSLLYQINSILAEKGIEINIDYSDYSEFVHFSSAKTRLENFYYKLSLIESYTSNSNLSSGSSNIYASSSQIIWDNKINEIITNFDGY
jgi:hypothetical protein